MKRRWIIVLLLSQVLTGLIGQSFSGDLEIYLNSLIDILPGSSGDLYTPPDPEDLDTWKYMIMNVLSDELDEARQKAEQLNYRITDFEDHTTSPAARYYVVEEKNPQTHYWGTYILNRDPLRPELVIQSPHTIFDSNTGYQGVFCYKRLGALALFLSGTHRCNHSSHTECSGSTTVCGGVSEPYRISDNAHNTQSVFQMSTQVLFDEVEDTTVFVQLHGFSKLSGDPYVIMSNGTRITPEPDYIGTLRNELLEEDNVLTFKIVHQDLDWLRLTAFTNTQGRYINGSSDPCTENATDCSGRFIHIEQERSRLRADSSGWHTMFRALERTFPARPVSTRTRNTERPATIRLFPNPAAESLRIESNGPFIYSIYSGSGQCLLESRSESRQVEIDLGAYSSGIYVVRVLDAGGIYSGKIIVQ